MMFSISTEWSLLVGKGARDFVHSGLCRTRGSFHLHCINPQDIVLLLYEAINNYFTCGMLRVNHRFECVLLFNIGVDVLESTLFSKFLDLRAGQELRERQSEKADVFHDIDHVAFSCETIACFLEGPLVQSCLMAASAALEATRPAISAEVYDVGAARGYKPLIFLELGV